MTNHEQKPKDALAIDSFWKEELAGLPVCNHDWVATHAKDKATIEERRLHRLSIVFTCMDERTTLVEDALGLLPGEASVYASAGARITIEAFESLFGKAVLEANSCGRTVAVYLVTHEAAGEPDKGCAAFANDVLAQTAYFTKLKQEIAQRFPWAYAHAVMLDSTTYALRPIAVDARDAAFAAILAAKGPLKFHAEEVAHAGHGIYIGDCYRAWVPCHNRYFRLSARNVELVGNVGIALAVMQHHSVVDLCTKPIVLHVDYPIYRSMAESAAAAANIDAALARLLDDDAVKAHLADGTLRLVKTETDIESWRGTMLSSAAANQKA